MTSTKEPFPQTTGVKKERPPPPHTIKRKKSQAFPALVLSPPSGPTILKALKLFKPILSRVPSGALDSLASGLLFDRGF